jgi:hypothetical protein
MSNNSDPTPEGGRSRTNWILIGFLAIAAFFLITEHTAHVLGALPYLILLACPLLHFFMHRGHDGHPRHGHRHDAEKEDRK